jgi:hypothetical protein
MSMRRAVAARRTQQRRRYRSLASFYTADDRRIHSRERDVGLWWREDVDGPLHRAAWVSDTGELYLVRLGSAEDGGGQVEVLATVLDGEQLEEALEGWRERCGEPRSLSWLRERAALSLSASADSAPGRPAGVAPPVRASRRTGATAGGYLGRGRVLPVAPQPAHR